MILSSTNLFTYINAPIAVATGAVGADAQSDSVSGIQALIVLFDGSTSTSDDTIANYAWSFGDGGSTSGPAKAVVSHTFYAFGTYTATLTVTDSFGQTDTDTVSITVTEDVDHLPPTAIIQASVTSGSAPLAVQFDASDSSPWTDLRRLVWDFGDGEGSSSANPRHIFIPDDLGTTIYPVTLTVYDIYGHSGTATVDITVEYLERIVPQITSMSPQQGAEDGGTAITVRGENLFAASSVSLVSRTGGSYPASMRKYSDTAITVITTPGTTSCDVVLSYHGGETGHPRTITQFDYIDGPLSVAKVSDDNINFGGTVSVEPDEVVYFSSFGSDAAVSYLWDFGDGTLFNFGDLNTSNAANPTHSYQFPGSFLVTLTVTDTEGLTGTSTCHVNVSVPAGWPGGEGPGTGGSGGGNGGGNGGGPGGIPYEPPEGTPGPALWLDASCEVEGRYSVETPIFTVTWTSFRRTEHVQFDAVVTVLEEFNAYAAYIGGISTSADGGFPVPNPTVSTVSTMGYNPSTATISPRYNSGSPGRVLNGLFAPTLFAPGAFVEELPTFEGGTIEAGTVFTMRVRAPLTYDIAFASLGFLDSRGLNCTDSAFAFLKTNCTPEPLAGGWRVGSIGTSRI